MKFLTLYYLSTKIKNAQLPFKYFITFFGFRIIFQVLFFVSIAFEIGGEDYLDYALYGNIFLPALAFFIVEIFNSSKEEFEEERIDILKLTGKPVYYIIFCKTFGYLFYTLIVIYLTYIVSFLVLGKLSLESFTRFLQIAPIVILAITSIYVTSLLFASLNIPLFLQYNLPNFFILLLMFLGNINYPINFLPKFLQFISMWLPGTNSISFVREFMINNKYIYAYLFREIFIILSIVVISIYTYNRKGGKND